MKATKQQIEKENSYPKKIIIERKCEGFSPSDALWEVAIIPWGTWKVGKFGMGKYTPKKAKQGWINDKDMEKVLKVINKLEEYK